MYYRLKDYPIRVVCPDDLDVHIDVEETGKTAVENAWIKASAYYQALKIPTIAGDSGVYIDGISPEEQPGLYVRRVNGDVLSDDEMIAYYAGLAGKADRDCILHYFTGTEKQWKNGFTTISHQKTERKAPVWLRAIRV